MPTTGAFTPEAESTAEALAIAKRWWLYLILGILLGIIGLVLLFNIYTAVRTLAVFVAIALMFEGVESLVNADRFRHKWVSYVLGVIWILTGIWALAWPGITLWALAVVVGVGLIVGGIVAVVASIADHRNLPLWGLWLVLGVVSVIVGIWSLAWPGATVVVLSILLGARLFIDGVLMVAFSFSLRRFNQHPTAFA